MRRAGSGARARVALLAAVVFTATAGCGSTSTKSVGVDRTGEITWKPCRNAQVQCATLPVPLDADAPNGPRVSLALARRPASGKSQGVLLTNPGGPGASGVEFLDDAGAVFGPAMRSHFDIVSWDPRGVGESDGVRCEDDLDEFYSVDRTPADQTAIERNVEVAQKFAASCGRLSGPLLEHVSTADSVRDMDAIRAAMAVDKISYIGFSYGTLLGAEYAARYPRHIGRMVLDGAIDPSLSSADASIMQAQGFDDVLRGFFAWCRGDTACGFARGGDPVVAFDSLAARSRPNRRRPRCRASRER